MRKLVCGLSLSLLAGAAVAAESFTIDSSHTYPNFTINHLGFSTTHGRFDHTSGSLTIDWENNTGSIELVIDAESINTGFKKRDDHLRSPDFLNAAEFPEITYKSTKITIHKDKTATVEGKLTMMDVSQPVSLSVNAINCGDHPFKKGTYVCGFDAEGQFKRSDFGVKYGLPAVGDEMKLMIQLEATRN